MHIKITVDKTRIRTGSDRIDKTRLDRIGLPKHRPDRIGLVRFGSDKTRTESVIVSLPKNGHVMSHFPVCVLGARLSKVPKTFRGYEAIFNCLYLKNKEV